MKRYLVLSFCIAALVMTGCSASKQSQLKSDFSRATLQAGSDAKNFGKSVVNGASNIYEGSKEAAGDFVDELSDMGKEVKSEFY